MGVRRAVEMAENCLENNVKTQGSVFSFGPLIHNKTALKTLALKGLSVLDSENIDSLKHNDTVIIRAHGIPPKIRHKIETTGAKIVDATCPRVLSSQKRASNFAKKGFTIILAGDKNHGEVAGIAGCAESFGAKCIVVENVMDAKKIPQCNDKAILLSQTTISHKEYDDIARILQKRMEHFQVFDTICPATSERQKSLEKLAKKVEGIIVIGGKNSANTQRLFLASQKYCDDNAYECKISCHIETPDEIPENFFQLKSIGITAGASTPDNIIDEVEEILIGKSC